MTDLLIGIVAGGVLGGAGAWLWQRRSRVRAASSPASGADPAAGRDELISKISHELKNPIMSVKGLASTGSRLYASMSDDERRELFGLIDAEAGRLKLIAEETSTVLKIDAGTLTYDFRDEDVGRLVEETAWRTPVGDHPVTVSTDAELVATADRTRLAEALSNLMDNAAKFSPSGSPIDVRAGRVDGGIGIEVRDAGPGIPDERKPSAFARYGMWRPAGYEEVPGAGLGLFIAKAHVAAHRGRMDIEDAEPRGTILRIWLPSGG